MESIFKKIIDDFDTYGFRAALLSYATIYRWLNFQWLDFKWLNPQSLSFQWCLHLWWL